MADYDRSIVELVKTAVRDAQDLVRSEIALAKAELREEGRRLALGAGLLGGAVVAGVLGLVFLLTTLAWGLTAAFEWPVWAGFAVVALVMLALAAALAVAGRSKFAKGQHLPRTLETMKENAQWIRARTS